MANTVRMGEYITRYLPEGCKELTNIWTRERWILDEDQRWIGGHYFWLVDHVFSLNDPAVYFKLSSDAVNPRMLAGRPVYSSCSKIRDATTDKILFCANFIWPCDAGLAVQNGTELYFTDGVREDLSMGKIMYGEDVKFLRVSETEYSLRVGSPRTGYRYFLLDVAKWTCISK